jgi:AAA15 family ATPase/GTPase
MVFAVHDTNLLRSDLLRRDQIWFTEKKETGETDLYSLAEFKIDQAEYVSSDTLGMEKEYLAGRYGAIPFLGNLQRFINEFASKESHVE